MPTTSRIITRPYRPTVCRVVEPRGYMPCGVGEWALVLALGALASGTVVALIEWASNALAGR